MLNKLALGAVVACGFAAIGTSGASAATCPAAECFDHVVLVAGPGAANVVTPSSSHPLEVTPASLTPTGPTTANYTVDPSGISFPTYNTTAAGFAVTINTTLANTANGTLNFATGANTLQADFLSTVTLGGVAGDCKLDTGVVNMSTANTQPLMGVNFPSGTSGPTTGAGAFGGTWSSITPTPEPSSSSACTLLSIAGYFGRGGLWVSRDLTPPSPKVTHSKTKTLKYRHTEAIKVTVANSGGVGTGPVKLCLKAPKGLKVNKACQTITNDAGGKSSVVTFKVKATKKKTKTYKLTLTPSTTTMGLLGNQGLAAQSFKLKVKK